MSKDEWNPMDPEQHENRIFELERKLRNLEKADAITEQGLMNAHKNIAQTRMLALVGLLILVVAHEYLWH